MHNYHDNYSNVSKIKYCTFQLVSQRKYFQQLIISNMFKEIT